MMQTERERKMWNTGWKMRGTICALALIGLIITIPGILRYELDSDSDINDTDNQTQMQVKKPADPAMHDLRRRKRALFKGDEWKPWGFDATALKAEELSTRNSWYSFLRYLARQSRGNNKQILAIQGPPMSWSNMFNLTANPTPCVRQILAIMFYQSSIKQGVYSSWEQRVGRCISSVQLWANATGLMSPETYACTLHFCQTMHQITKHTDIDYAVPQEIPYAFSESEGTVCICNSGSNKQSIGFTRCTLNLAGLAGRPNFRNVSFNVGTITTVANNSVNADFDKGVGPVPNCYWQCGKKAFLYLPNNWTGCCQLVNLTLNNIVFLASETTNPGPKRQKRDMAEFHTLESYHWRISLGEKWGIGIFPWYGVTFLADHIDNITYTMSGFANETIRGFSYLSDNDRSHRLTLLKHEIALDYLMAKTGGLCVTLNFTGDACMTLIPDNDDNLTSVIRALGKIRNSFGPSDSAGQSLTQWLQDRLGPWGAVALQVLFPFLIMLGAFLCLCSCTLTCMRALLHRWIASVVGGKVEQYALLRSPKRESFDPWDVADSLPDIEQLHFLTEGSP